MDPGQNQTTLQSRSRHYFVPVMVLMVLSLCLQIAGFASPGWIVLENDGYLSSSAEVHIGLWMVRTCHDGKCETQTIEEVDKNNILAHELNEYRVETCLAIACIVIAIIVVWFRRQNERLQSTAFAVIILTAISGILALIASGKVADDTRKSHELWTNLLRDDSPYRFPYSVFLTGLGGIFACITTLIEMCCVKPCTNQAEPPPAYAMTSQPPSYTANSYPMQHAGQPYMAQSGYSGQLYMAQPGYSGQPYMAQPGYSGQPYMAQPGYTVQPVNGEYQDNKKQPLDGEYATLRENL